MKITMNMKMRIFDGLYLQKVLFNIWKCLKDFKNIYCNLWHDMLKSFQGTIVLQGG